MAGLIFLFVIFVWIAFLMFMTELLTRKLAAKWWRLGVAIPLYLAFLILPVFDELIGRGQFEQLCAEHADIHIDVATTEGRTVAYHSGKSQFPLNTAVPITIESTRYVDVNTGEQVFHFETVKANAGFLSRHLPFPEDPQPLFMGSYCSPGQVGDMLKKLGLTRVENASGTRKNFRARP